MPEADDTHRGAPAEYRTIDLDQPSEARLYDLFLGGKNNFEVERRLYQDVVKLAPETPQLAAANRRWLAHAIGRMVIDGHIGQFLDLGAGLPTLDNTHEIVARADPDGVVVYVDNDLTAVTHGQALLADYQHSFFAEADLTDPAAVLRHPVVTEAIDLSRPVGLLLGMVLQAIPDTEQAARIVAEYLAAVPAGSYLALTHPVNPRDGSRFASFARSIEEKLGEAFPNLRFRTPAEVGGFLTGLQLVPPGLVDLASWPLDGPGVSAAGAGQLLLVALGRKP
ncbi:SAM-dependent methyltransferase [Kribbella sp. NPDC026611]|uniref:SAM-dependent methyltransferase n=1 Tax=Kribbella sp. NPDC026611 TaxID=3154911 RepID=UPI0033C30E96